MILDYQGEIEMRKSILPLRGKVAIVTGAKYAIGRAIALGFAEAGADIALCTRVFKDNMHDLGAVAEEIKKLGRRCIAMQTDIGKKADVDHMVQKVINEFGRIDILINNASVMLVKQSALDHSEEDWDRVINTDLKGYYFCCKAVGKKMIEARSGNIINMASTSGMRPPHPPPTAPLGPVMDTTPYSIAKAGIILLTKLLAKELAQYNIRFNCIAPGPVKTEMTPEDILREWKMPLGRWSEPSDFVGPAVFLASEDSSYITGHILVVDGGLSL